MRDRLPALAIIFAITIMLLVPVNDAVAIVSLYRAIGQGFNIDQELLLVLIAVIAVIVVVNLSGVYTAIAMLRRWPQALSLAKRYLLLNFFTALVFYLLLLSAQPLVTIIILELKALLFFVLWLLYFNRSQQLKAIFGEGVVAPARGGLLTLSLQSSPASPAVNDKNIAQTAAQAETAPTAEQPPERVPERGRGTQLEAMPPTKRSIRRE